MKGSSINTPKGRALVSTEILLQNSQVINLTYQYPEGRALVSTATFRLFYHAFSFYPIYCRFPFAASQKLNFAIDARIFRFITAISCLLNLFNPIYRGHKPGLRVSQ